MLPRSELRTFGPCLYIQNSAAANAGFYNSLELGLPEGDSGEVPSALAVYCLRFTEGLSSYMQAMKYHAVALGKMKTDLSQ